MKVKSFNNYRAPRRHDWLWGVLGVVVLLGLLILMRGCISGCVQLRAERREARAAAKAAAEVARTAEVVEVVGPSGKTVVRQATPGVANALAEAVALERDGDLIAARERYWALLDQVQGHVEQNDVETRLGRISTLLLLSPRQSPEKVDDVVRSGDTVDKIARKHGCTIELIQTCNNMSNVNLIKVGDRFRVPTGTFEVVSSKGRNDLLVTMNGKFFKRYRVGSGKFGKTPVGTFKVREKIKEPIWWRPDGSKVEYGQPGNVLGTRWLGLKPTGDTEQVRGYGIHGTWENDSIGRASSEGCLRMLNSDVEELFIYIPEGTKLTITE
jgi:lipoprotein-anchoring transpeptidase ErfK/SrfK